MGKTPVPRYQGRRPSTAARREKDAGCVATEVERNDSFVCSLLVYTVERKGPLREKSQAPGRSKERKREKGVRGEGEKRLSNVMTREGGRRVSQYFIRPISDGTKRSSSPCSRFLCSTAAGSASLLLNRKSPSLRTAPNSIFCALSYHSLSLLSLETGFVCGKQDRGVRDMERGRISICVKGPGRSVGAAT